MPVNSLHADFVINARTWAKIRTTVSGEEAVKRDEAYLPRPRGMLDADYNSYRARAKFYAAAERTLAAFVGLVQRKAPDIRIDDPQLAYLITDVDGHGTPLSEFAGRVLAEVLMMGRLAVTVDVVDNRVVLTSHVAESVINWAVDGDDALNMVVISNIEVAERQTDPYVLETEQVYRSWRIDDDGAVIYEKFIENAGSAAPSLSISTELLNLDGAINSLPVVIIGTSGVHASIDRSLLSPIVNLSLHHYMLSADRNWGLHFVALPTPYIIGVNPDQAPNVIGPTTLWAIPNENAKVGMLEFGGAGLREIAMEMDDDKREIADMGARILESKSRSAEAAGTVAMKSHSDSANLNTVCAAVSDGITRALRIGAAWLGRPDVDEIGFAVNRDFLPVRMDPTELTALVGAWINGALSNQELYAALQEGEIVDPGKLFDKHLEEIDQTQSSRGGVTVTEDAVGNG